mmetsp:Transcript_87398/g.154689  ORF Transcript_87398/g.154689 Transcript_87398/m.154689 type:complete len:82 (+) Transcript_87398:355-600(+)
MPQEAVEGCLQELVQIDSKKQMHQPVVGSAAEKRLLEPATALRLPEIGGGNSGQPTGWRTRQRLRVAAQEQGQQQEVPAEC